MHTYRHAVRQPERKADKDVDTKGEKQIQRQTNMQGTVANRYRKMPRDRQWQAE